MHKSTWKQHEVIDLEGLPQIYQDLHCNATEDGGPIIIDAHTVHVLCVHASRLTDELADATDKLDGLRAAFGRLFRDYSRVQGALDHLQTTLSAGFQRWLR